MKVVDDLVYKSLNVYTSSSNSITLSLTTQPLVYGIWFLTQLLHEVIGWINMHLNLIFGKSIEIFGGGNEVKYHWENDDLGNIQFVVLVRFLRSFCGIVWANFIILKVISI